MAKEIQQVKNYQVNQTMVDSARNKAILDELAAEILDVKKYQMSAVPMGSSSSPQKECYTVWAHQQANPNLVEMPVHKVTKQIYDNKDNNRPMFYGFLKSDRPPSESAPPPPSSNDPQNPPN
ncbi:hypothetical protein PIB30_088469 [Stylosanthes scabra]|uniref:Uncharacterized protein n=1 Tax=Stylosanthes scabra TaxID=79078 RepID=A0ABU6TU70_9FABA|nr:hypothetical protein [Stylosanthes scabra]